MTDRRDFIRYASAALAALTSPLIRADQKTQLPTRPIPGTDEQLPIIGFGNSSAFRSGDLDVTRQLLDVFLESGGAYIDAGLSGSETIGRVLSERSANDKVFVGSYIDSTDGTAARDEIEALQKAQGKATLDLVHTRNINHLESNPQVYGQWKDDGLTRYVGVARSNSSFYDQIVRLMNAGSVDFIQVNYSMLEPEAAERVLPLAQEKGVAVLINRPFVNGQYFSIVKEHELPAWAADFDCHSWAQFSLKYILAHPAVNCVLTETSKPHHAIDNLQAGFGRLPDEAMRQRMLGVIRGIA